MQSDLMRKKMNAAEKKSSQKEKESPSSLKPVQMRFMEQTISKVENLVKLRHAKNKTQVVAEAISVFHLLCLTTEKEGGKIIIEYPNGEKERILLP